MSLVHHIPDIAVVPCLGCDELVREHELVKHADHGERSCCFWHPYHLWCIRDATPGERDMLACDEELRRLRADLPSGWVRAVCRRP